MELNSILKIFIIIYFTVIAAEATYSFYHHKNYYSLKDTLVNFSLGVLAVVLRFLTKGVWLTMWIYIYQYVPFQIPSNVVTWFVLFLANEFVYYWFHRLSHENQYLWAVHVNHHSSEHLNFSVSARVPFLNIILHNIFWIPLLLVGFSPTMIFTVETLSFLFSFLQHTQTVRKIPLIEFLFNTPSHHRVHHASNPEYINKNYGNVLIIYDRIFGTFKKEEEDIKLRFGLTENIRSFNLFKVVFHEWITILNKRHKSDPSIKLKINNPMTNETIVSK